MSKERELLESCLAEMQYHNLVRPELKIEIKELLAKPEYEVCASKYKDILSNVFHVVDAFSSNCDAALYSNEIHQACADLQELRHNLRSLSDDEVKNYLARQSYQHFKWDDGFKAGVKWAEKVHGIGL